MDERKRPWWVETLWNVGPVTGGFVVLLGVVLGWIPSPLLDGARSLAENQKSVKETLRSLQRIETQLDSHVRDSQYTQQTMTKTLRQICRNTAKSAEGKEYCE